MPVRFGLVRIRAHAQRTLIVAAGIAVAAAVLAMTAVGAVAVQDRAAQQALGALQPSDRSVQAVWSGVPGQSSRCSNSTCSRSSRCSPMSAFAVTERWRFVWRRRRLARITVHGGHLPAPHGPLRSCRSAAPAAPKLPFLHAVGRATFRRGSPLSSYCRDRRRPPILLANGVQRLLRSRTPRSRIRLGRPAAPGIHTWG